MSLTLRLLTIIALLNSFSYGDTSDKVEDYIEEKFAHNKRIDSLDVNVDDVVKLDRLKGWNAYMITLNAVMKDKEHTKATQRMIWFSNGSVVTKELTDLQTGENFVDLVKPTIKQEQYKKENLIYGNVNARHKITIFSDPLCPFCRSFIPGAIKEMKKYPKKYAIYYHHFPLLRIHPASGVLVRAAVAAELKGIKDVTLKLYNVKVSPTEKDIKKILKAFNKAVGTKIKPIDLNNPSVVKRINDDLGFANDLMVSGTPTLYVNGKFDKAKNRYKKMK